MISGIKTLQFVHVEMLHILDLGVTKCFYENFLKLAKVSREKYHPFRRYQKKILKKVVHLPRLRIDEMGGNSPGGNFPGDSPAGNLSSGNFPSGSFPGGIFLEPEE